MKHTHKAEDGFVFRICPKCKEGATYQHKCKICGKVYCRKCIEIQAIKETQNILNEFFSSVF